MACALKCLSREIVLADHGRFLEAFWNSADASVRSVTNNDHPDHL